MNYKKTVGAVILGVLVLLIFFSKTIYNHNLPIITATKPENGRLSKLETTTGIVNWSETENIYAALGGKVDEVLVKEGDAVVKGQELYRLTFDKDEAERRLREIENRRNRLYTEIQNINLRLEKQNRATANLAAETYEEEDVATSELHSLDYRLDVLALRIREARDTLREARDLRDDGEFTDSDVDKARYALQALELERDDLERQRAEKEQEIADAREKAAETVADQEATRESQLKDYEADVAALRLELQAKNIELSNLTIEEEPYKQTLADYEAFAAVIAPIGGTIISLNAVKSETIAENQLLAEIGASGTFEIECDISLDNNFVIPGDMVELSNSSHVLEGTVSKITPKETAKTVTVTLESPEVTAGETFDINFQKDSETTYTFVPNGAVNRDNDGYFLNQVRRRDGIMGEEYYLERLDVFIGDSDAENTVITQGIMFFEPIMLNSDKPVKIGDVVALENERDFFEE